MRSVSLLAAAALAAMLPVAAGAQTTPAPAPAPAPQAAPKAGDMVYDGAGGEVGTIESVASAGAVINTGTHKVTIPLASIGTGPKGPTLGLTKAELDAAAATAAAGAADQLKAKLVAGAEVRGKAGDVLGTVKSSDAASVTLTAAAGGKDVRVPIGAMGVNAQGLMLNMTAEEFAAAVAAVQ